MSERAVYQLPTPPAGGRVFIAPDVDSLALSIEEAQLPDGSYEVASEDDLVLPPPEPMTPEEVLP